MRTRNQTNLRRALLQTLANTTGYLLPDELLRAEASRLVHPRPVTADLDSEIRAVDTERLIIGVQGEDCTKWKITDAGRVWLGENP